MAEKLAPRPAATLLLLRGEIGRLAGLLLVGLYAGYVWYVIRRERIPLETEEGTVEELAEELADLARWLGLDGIVVEPRGDLAAELAVAVKAVVGEVCTMAGRS